MAVVEDGWHCVQPSEAQACSKADTGVAPNASYMLFVQLKGGGQQVCRWADEGARDDFYKKLVSAMGSV